MKRYSARQWALTLRVFDALVSLLVLSIAWATYSMNRSGGEFRWPLSWVGFAYLALIPVIRGIAVREKRKSEEAERRPARNGKRA
jgi:hypothetical protein